MKDLKKLEKVAREAQIKYQEALDEYEKKELRPILRKRVGQCFAYVNSYGGDSEKWNLYTKVLSLDASNNYVCEQFEETPLGIIEIELSKTISNYGNDSLEGRGYVQITPMEYEEARQKLIDKLL